MGGRNDFRPEKVRALVRGLDILRDVNKSGGTRAGDVARRLGLARPTVYRLLETLEELGYVVRSASGERFRVTRRASSLGGGYDAGIAVMQAAYPVMRRLGDRFVWPVDLSVYEDGAMVVQESTHKRSPASIDLGMVGSRLPMLRTAAGRIYLASCSEAERTIIVQHLRQVDDPADRPSLTACALDNVLGEAHERRYAERIGGAINERTSSIAVAIRHGDTVLGCIAVIWITSALPMQQAVAELLGPLREAAAEIGSAVEITSP